MKRAILSLLMALVISGNLCCYAYSDVDDAELEGKLQVLSDMSIISGYEDETFRPHNNITRAEFSKIIMSVIIVDSAFADEGAFDDTDGHWAEGYISLAKHFGIINGTTETTFEPEANVTYEQAIKMIVAALGYNAAADEEGGYPNGYILVAQRMGILNGISFVKEDSATRENIAKMIYNALEVPFYFLTISDDAVEYALSEYTLYELYQTQSNAVEIDDDTVDIVDTLDTQLETDESVDGATEEAGGVG